MSKEELTLKSLPSETISQACHYMQVYEKRPTEETKVCLYDQNPIDKIQPSQLRLDNSPKPNNNKITPKVFSKEKEFGGDKNMNRKLDCI